MDASTIRAIIAKREQTNDEWQFGVEQCWAELVDALTEDLDWTKAFLTEECSADELSWIGEVFDELVEKTYDESLVAAIRRAIAKYPEENALHHLDENLDLSIKMYMP